MTARGWLVLVAAGLSACQVQVHGGVQSALLDPAQGEAAAMAALGRLRKESAERPRIRFVRGLPVFATMQVKVLAPADPVGRALAFLERYRELYRLADPRRDLFLSRLVQAGGRDHVFFGQRHGQIPVFAAELAVHLEGDRVTSTNGRYAVTPPAPVAVRLTAADAERAALKLLAEGARERIGRPEVVHYDASIVGEAKGAEPPRPVWAVAVRGVRASDKVSGAWTVLVDAVTGQSVLVLDRRRGHAFTLAIDTIDGSHVIHRCITEPPLTPETDGTAARASEHLRRTVDYFHDRFGIHSWDDSRAGTLLLHWPDPLTAQYSEDCNDLRFSDSYLTLDVLAHEFTHGMVARLGPRLLASGLPRVVDESYADVFGAMVDDDDWRIGEDTSEGALRDLSDPVSLGHPDAVPATVDTSDPYRLAGVLNKAAYLISEGGTHGGVSVTGIGREKMEQLYFETLRTQLTSTSDWHDVRDATVAQAGAFWRAGDHGFVRADVCPINDAFASVGLGATCAAPEMDADGDEVPDLIDNCPVANPWQGDFDGDGLGDRCDEDEDGDGVFEDGDRSGRAGDAACRDGNVVGCDDNCRRLRNPDQQNRDGDARGDACDDSDGDREPDAFDNCPDRPNPGQENLDGDRLGDACDDDVDGDGVPERGFAELCTGGVSTGCLDNCVVMADLSRSQNGDQADSDGDRLGDRCDNCPGFDSRVFSDVDADGVGDVCDVDADNDGVCNAGWATTADPPRCQFTMPADARGLGPEGCSHAGGLYACGDNCPITANVDQLDFDHDGVGTLCDRDEPGIFSGEITRRVSDQIRAAILEHGIFLPIGPCLADGCPDYLTPDFRTDVLVKAGDIPLDVSILDGRGSLVARSSSGQGGLRFAPRADTHYRASKGEKPFRGQRYVVVVKPARPLAAGQEKGNVPFELRLENAFER